MHVSIVGEYVWSVVCITFSFSNPLNAAFQPASYIAPFVAFSFTACMFSSTGAEKLTKGTHNISGIKLRVTVGQVPTLSQLQQAIMFPSACSTAPQVMQPPPHVLPQHATQSVRPVPIPRRRTKKPTSSLMTDETSVLSVAAQGLSLATADNQPFTQSETSTIEINRLESVAIDVGSPVQARSQGISHSTPLPTDSITRASMTPTSPVVRVVGILPGWSERVLTLAFDNEEEGGGEIEENGIRIKGSEALITFKDPDGKFNFLISCACMTHSLTYHEYALATCVVDMCPTEPCSMHNVMIGKVQHSVMGD